MKALEIDRIESLPRTEWFPQDVLPVHEGVYERALEYGHRVWAYWNGHVWGIGFSKHWLARKPQSNASVSSIPGCWRGLTEEYRK